MSKNKVKKRDLIARNYCTNCFNPTHLKFNFSFITYEKGFSKEYQIQFLNRIRELSKVPYLEMMQWPKAKGLEIEKININKEISINFFNESSHREFNDKKYAIFRLYPNDNPIEARIIGRLIDKIFYIFFIDIGGNLYHH